MATAREMQLLELLQDPYRNAEAHGVYGKYHSMAEAAADELAEAQERAKALRRSGIFPELQKAPVAPRTQEVVKHTIDPDTGERIQTVTSVEPVPAPVAGQTTLGPAIQVGGRTVTPVVAAVAPTPQGFIGEMDAQGRPMGRNYFSMKPFGREPAPIYRGPGAAAVAEPEIQVTPEMFRGKAFRPAFAPTPTVEVAPAPAPALSLSPTTQEVVASPEPSFTPQIGEMTTAGGGVPITSSWFFNRMAPRGSMAFESAKGERIKLLQSVLTGPPQKDLTPSLRRELEQELVSLSQPEQEQRPSYRPFFEGRMSPFQFQRP